MAGKGFGVNLPKIDPAALDQFTGHGVPAPERKGLGLVLDELTIQLLCDAMISHRAMIEAIRDLRENSNPVLLDPAGTVKISVTFFTNIRIVDGIRARGRATIEALKNLEANFRQELTLFKSPPANVLPFPDAAAPEDAKGAG